MNPNEFNRLYAYHKNNQRRKELSMRAPFSGRRSVKNRGKAVGQVLRDSRVKSEVRMLECNPVEG